MKQTCWPWVLAQYLSWLPKYKTCSYHDKRYEFATVRNETTRAKIDRVFLAQMLIEKPVNVKTAYCYYYIVKVFWWIRFYF